MASGAFDAHLTQLNLSSNRVGDAGMRWVAHAVAAAALPRLEYVKLHLGLILTPLPSA